MYCKVETLKLALSKGFTKCTCSVGGWPDCICESTPYINTRLDDVQNWLREDKQLHIMYILVLTPNLQYKFYVGKIENNKYLDLWNPKVVEDKKIIGYLYYNTYEEGQEAAIVNALELI